MFLGDIVGGIGDFLGGAIGGVMDALNPLGMVGDLVGGVLGGALGPLGDMLGGVAGGITDMFFPGGMGMGSIGDIVGNLFGGQGGLGISPFPPFPGGIPDFGFGGIGGGEGGGGMGGVGGSDLGGGGLDSLIAMLGEKADKMYGDLENEINNLDPESKSFQKDMQKVQLAMSKYTQMTELLSNVQKNLHDMSMSIVRNIKG